MVADDLAHLPPPDRQDVGGRVQDDEALFLFALVRHASAPGPGGRRPGRLQRAQPPGGDGTGGVLYMVDLALVPSVAPNHRTITRDVVALIRGDLDGCRFDMISFDAHA